MLIHRVLIPTASATLRAVGSHLQTFTLLQQHLRQMDGHVALHRSVSGWIVGCCRCCRVDVATVRGEFRVGIERMVGGCHKLQTLIVLQGLLIVLVAKCYAKLRLF